MPSLAALRYRNVLADCGGPIERLETAEVTVLGEPGILANAYLRTDLRPAAEGQAVFSPASGSGTARSPMVARFMAVSEAMERWAHHQLQAEAGPHRFGFDTDPSSNGMAAFPGLWRRQARPAALMEAAERFNVLNWWERRLPALESETPWPGVRAVTICSEAPGLTVILFKCTTEGFFAYGHAAAMNFDAACRKAAVEMQRHELAVSRFARTHAGEIRNQLRPEAHPIERRSLFFALAEGHELFLERLRSRPTKAAPSLKVVFDGFIPGPWSRYADVWRVVYLPPSDRFLGREENYFLW